MNKEQQDEQTAKTIWHDALQNSTKPLTWGICFKSIKAISNGTSFHVDKMKSVISIICLSGLQLYRVVILPDNSKKSIVYENVKLENIVPVIDQVITHASKYQPAEFHKIPNMQERMAV